MNKFLGVPYPVSKDPKGYFHAQGGVEQIKSDMLQLLLTNPGERVMLPTFGTPLRDLFFEPNDATLEARTKQLIASSIQQWEPRIVISQIVVSSKLDASVLNKNDDRAQDEMILSIKIQFFDPANINSVQDLVLEVPLQGK